MGPLFSWKTFEGKFKFSGRHSQMPLTAQGNVSNIEEEAAINSIITDALPIENSKSLFLKELIDATQKDPILSQVLKFIKINWNCSKEKIPEIILPYYRIRDELFIWNGNCI